MKRLLAFVFSFISLVAFAHKDNEKALQLGEIFILPDSIALNSLEESPDPTKAHHFTVNIENSSSSHVSGYVTFSKRHIFAEKWLFIEGSDTLKKSKYSQDLYLELEPNQKGRIVFHLDELDMNDSLGFHIQAFSEAEFEKEIEEINKSQSFFVGILIFLCVFNLILYLVTSWKVYGIYSVYIASALLYILYYFGFIQTFFEDPSFISINVASILYPLFFVVYFYFIIQLGNLKETSPKGYLLLKIGIFYQLFQVAYELVFYYSGISVSGDSWYKNIFLVFELLLLIGIIYYLIKSKNFRTRVVLYGSCILALFATLAQLNTGYNPIYVLELGILLELLAFSVALGYITRKYYTEKLETEILLNLEQKKNQLIQQKMQSELEEKVIERTAHLKKTTTDLEKRNKENTILLGEVHHRVKNNLQMISSMLRMQYRHLINEESKNALAEALQRINTIGLLHEHLYREEQGFELSTETYVTQLWEMIKQGSGNIDWSCEIDAPKNNIDMDLAFKIGIILNELITNSLKYSDVKKNDKLIKVRINKNTDHYFVEVEDFGKNSMEKIEEGFGYKMIRLLTREKNDLQISLSKNNYKVSVKISFEK